MFISRMNKDVRFYNDRMSVATQFSRNKWEKFSAKTTAASFPANTDFSLLYLTEASTHTISPSDSHGTQAPTTHSFPQRNQPHCLSKTWSVLNPTRICRPTANSPNMSSPLSKKQLDSFSARLLTINKYLIWVSLLLQVRFRCPNQRRPNLMLLFQELILSGEVVHLSFFYEENLQDDA
jgi:hypothetical protein